MREGYFHLCTGGGMLANRLQITRREPAPVEVLRLIESRAQLTADEFPAGAPRDGLREIFTGTPR
jgi:hypothetical protein